MHRRKRELLRIRLLVTWCLRLQRVHELAEVRAELPRGGYSCRAGTPTRSRRYARVRGGRAGERPRVGATRLGARRRRRSSRSSCATRRSAASTAGMCASPGVAVGSESGAETGLVPALPHPRAAKRTTASLLRTTALAASSRSSSASSPVQDGSGEDAADRGASGSLHASPSPSMAARIALCSSSPFASHPPSWGGKSWQCV